MVQVLVQVMILALLLLAAPLLAGGVFDGAAGEGRCIPFRWVSGQMLLWAGFQLICVPLVLLQPHASFRYLCVCFGVYMAVVPLLGLGATLRRRAGLKAAGRLKTPGDAPAGERREKRDKTALLLWLAVFCLLVLQQALAAAMAYEEGDDAYYVAVSVVTESSDTMYQVMPYTGFTTGLDARHGLAPFPVWAAFLSRLSGVHAAAVSQVVLPVVLIAMAYSVFYLTGRSLLGKNGRGLPLFMLLIECLVIFGGQSLYTPENFLLVRTAQGKAVLANIAIPFLLWLLYALAEGLRRGEKAGFRYWLLLIAAMVSGCLCSAQGALMVCLLAGAGGLCTAVCCRSLRTLLTVAACCAAPAVFAVLYLLLG